MITVQEINGYTKKMALAYERVLQPLCRAVDLPHTALSILLFVANNPDFATASDICELRGLKKSIVSTHVERLVSEGYLERRAVPGDRRKDALVCTAQAGELIERGRALQVVFAEALLDGVSEDDRDVMERCFQTMDANVDRILKDHRLEGRGGDDR